MVKQSNNGHVNGVNGHNYSTPDIYTTSKGKKVKLIGLNPARLEKLQNAGTMPPVPFRLMETELGESQREELTADSLLTDQERKEWKEYIEKRNAIEARRSENVMKYVFHDGISIDDEILEEWKTEQEEVWGLEVPNNRIDLKVDFINAEIIGNSEDLGEIMAGVMERTGVSAEALDEVRATFRSDLRRSAAGETAAE